MPAPSDSHPLPPSRRLLPDTRRRDTLIAIGAGLAALAFILYAVYYFSRQADATGGVEGIIIAKEFTPRPEEQITIGRDGLRSRDLAGEYRFKLRVPRENNRGYELIVDSITYDSREVGDRFYFMRPSAGSD